MNENLPALLDKLATSQVPGLLSLRLPMIRWDGSCTPVPPVESGAAVQLPPQLL
ncbi:MAG TPA: hypothetical protein VIH42_09240 [Thermoguttaceae bacterium]